MKNLKVFLISILSISIIAIGLICFLPSNKNTTTQTITPSSTNTIAQEQSQPSSSTLTDKITVIDGITFTEHFSGQLISYLSITNNTGEPIDLYLEIGNITSSAQKINSGKTENFTQKAKYKVIYKKDKTTQNTYYSFDPQIHHDLLKNGGYGSTDTNGKIIYENDNYYILGNGYETITQSLQFNNKLYNIEILSNGNSIKSPTDSTTLTAYLWEINPNTYTEAEIKFITKDNTLSRSFKVTAINPQFDITFTNTNFEELTSDNHSFANNTNNIADYYVFNQAVIAKLTLNNGLTNSISSNPLSEQAKINCLNNITISIGVTNINATNNGILSTLTTLHNAITSDLLYNIKNELIDHTVYTLSTILNSNSSTTHTIGKNIYNYKIITKLPYSIQNGNRIYDLGLYPKSSGSDNNYLDTVLNGTITNDTIITFQNNTPTFISNKNNTNNNKYLRMSYTINGNFTSVSVGANYVTFEPSIDKSESVTMHIKSSASDTNYSSLNNFLTEDVYTNFDFNHFYYFKFEFKSYTNPVVNNITINNPNSNNLTALYNETTTKFNLGTFNKFDGENKRIYPKISFSSYNIEKPIYMQVDYNGRIFENFYNAKENDIIEFTTPGNYTVYLYTLPSFAYMQDILKDDINDESNKKTNFIEISFTIEGASIYAFAYPSNNTSAEPYALTNYMYTQDIAYIKMNILSNQEVRVFKNNELLETLDYNRINELENNTISTGKNLTGALRFEVVNTETNNIETSLEFTIINVNYQTFSISHLKEYENLTISKFNNETLTFDELEKSYSYHLTEAGTYKLTIQNNEKFYFNCIKSTVSEPISSAILVEKTLNINIVKPYFVIEFETGKAGDRIRNNVVITRYDCVNMQKLEVFLNNSSTPIYQTTESMGNTSGENGGIGNVIENLSGGDMSFNKTGTYTIRLTDGFGNVYEAQIEKYYKANAALIILIVIATAGIVLLTVFIYRSRRGIKVK